MKFFFTSAIFIFLFSCSAMEGEEKAPSARAAESFIDKKDTADTAIIEKTIEKPVKIFPIDTVLTNVPELDTAFILDIKYATKDNFVQEQLYACEACYLIKPAAEALAKAHMKLKEQGYRIKLFDCYRPHDVQKRMWEKIPNPTYVANPSKGSYHNRGMAVDLTLVDENGKELDMGTPYDYFGKKAHLNYTGLTKEQQKNRKILQKVMQEAGFKTITSEWWHFSYRAKKTPIYNLELPCD